MLEIIRSIRNSTYIISEVNITSEVSNRIASAMATWKSLDNFWKEAQCSTRNKICLVGGLEYFSFSQKYWVANHPN